MEVTYHENHTKGCNQTFTKRRRIQVSGIEPESKKAAMELAKAAMKEDRKYGIESNYGIARDVFGYYFAKEIND